MNYYQNGKENTISNKPRRTQSLLKYFFEVSQGENKGIEIELKPANKKQKLTFPSIYPRQLAQAPSQTLKSRQQLESTIFKLKSKYFDPHGASRTQKLETIKRKRLAEPSGKSFRTISVATSTQANHNLRGHRQNIISCTIEESILYG